jgi:hypothetical protein
MRVLIKDTKFCDIFEAVDVYYEIRNNIEGIHFVPLRTDYYDVFILNVSEYTSENICKELLLKGYIDLSMYSYITIDEYET